jgi:hypothetical protein
MLLMFRAVASSNPNPRFSPCCSAIFDLTTEIAGRDRGQFAASMQAAADFGFHEMCFGKLCPQTVSVRGTGLDGHHLRVR